MSRPALAALALLVAACGDMRLEDRTAAPRLPPSALEVVAELDHPPGNIAVSPGGRVFLSLHPAGDPPTKVVELIGGKPVPYPDAGFQEPRSDAPSFDTVLSLRIDRQDRLWTLDYARYGRGQPRLLAFDLHTNAVVHQYDFPSSVAGFLSMLNDFQVDPAGEHVYIAETSPIRQRPALVVYDVARRTSRRVLDGHPSVQAGGWVGFLAVLVVLNAAVAAFYYLRVVVYMFMRDPVSDAPGLRHGRLLWSGLAVATTLTIVLGLVPQLILGLIDQATAAIAG